MVFDKDMVYGIYKCCLIKRWTVARLHEDIDRHIMNVGCSVDEWTDNFCLTLERYKQ